MSFISTLRLLALCVVLVFAAIVVALSAHLTFLTDLEGPFTYAGLAIATAGITVITVPIMIALDFVQPGRAFTSKIVVEFSWLSILWVLWLATGADTADAAGSIFLAPCGDYEDSIVQMGCRETAGVEAFSFLNWLILMIYTVLILVLTLIAQSRKHAGVWSTTVGEAPFFTPGESSNSSVGMTQTGGMSQEHTGTSHVANTLNTGGYETQSYSQNVGGYEPQPYSHNIDASQGGTGPASVQAGTVHQMA